MSSQRLNSSFPLRGWYGGCAVCERISWVRRACPACPERYAFPGPGCSAQASQVVGHRLHRSVMAYHPPADYGRFCRLRLLLRLPQRKGPGAALDWQLPALRPAASSSSASSCRRYATTSVMRPRAPAAAPPPPLSEPPEPPAAAEPPGCARSDCSCCSGSHHRHQQPKHATTFCRRALVRWETKAASPLTSAPCLRGLTRPADARCRRCRYTKAAALRPARSRCGQARFEAASGSRSVHQSRGCAALWIRPKSQIRRNHQALSPAPLSGAAPAKLV